MVLPDRFGLIRDRLHSLDPGLTVTEPEGCREEAHGVGRGGELVAQRPAQFGALAEDVQVCATAAADLDAQVHQRALQAAEIF